MSPSLDILGESQPVPDPDAISGLASHYTSMSATMKDVHDQLTALQQDAHWTGSAATAFRANLSGLPGELTKAYDSYHDMGSTLSAYAQGVSDWLRKLTPAVNQANDVQHELEQARNALAQAQATGGDTAGLQARVNSLSGELQWYQGTIYRLFDDDLPALAGTCAQGIQNAENAGISNTFWGGLSQDLGDVGGVLATVGSDVGGFLMTVVVDPFKDLPGALAEVWEHPGSWKDWSNLLGDLSSCVGVLSLAFGGELLMVSSLALDTAHLGTDAVLVGEGEASPLDLAFDGVGVIADGTAVLGAGADAGEKAVADTAGDSATSFENADHLLAAGDTEAAAAANAAGVSQDFDSAWQQAHQTLGGLFGDGVQTIVSPGSWTSDLVTGSGSISDFVNAFKAPSEFASSAAVMATKISTVSSAVATTAGWTGEELHAHGIG